MYWWALRLLPYLGYCKKILQWTLECIYLFELVFLFSSNKHPGVKLPNCVVVLVLIFWGVSILFSIVATPIYILTHSAWGFPFLHILANICYLWSFWCLPFWQVWGDISLWFWFAFLWWLMMLSIFSCVPWPSIHLLWKNVYSGPPPIFKIRSFVFLMLNVWVLYIFWILIPYQIYCLQISSLLQ